MTRTIAGAKTSANASTLLAHHLDQARRKPLNALKTTIRHTLLTRGLTRTLTYGFGSIQSAEMSVLTMIIANFKETFSVRFSSHFTTIFNCVSNQAQFLTRTSASACSLDLDSITSKIVIL
jgi:hypothetical protein